MRNMVFVTILFVLLSNSYVFGVVSKKQSEAQIAHGNMAIEAWIECANGDERFLLYDQNTQILSFRHGKAVLRECLVEFEKLREMPNAKTILVHHLRRFRPLELFLNVGVGPYDWEERLVLSAPKEGALYFEDGTILGSSLKWAKNSDAVLLLSEKDFGALFNSCVLGVPLVILPVGWNYHG
jgi:hypothetical protein